VSPWWATPGDGDLLHDLKVASELVTNGSAVEPPDTLLLPAEIMRRLEAFNRETARELDVHRNGANVRRRQHRATAMRDRAAATRSVNPPHRRSVNARIRSREARSRIR
jgi:hypothetical protein